jgi:predicted hydrocarbon binding protein/KaiC/GvpD/RAD55 family RecA-like ATPase
MENRRASLAQITDTPVSSLILVTGPPGAGKSTFCHQVALNSLAIDRPVIFVTTEQRPAQVLNGLKERGLGQPTPEALSFVDAFSQTVGVAAPERPDTIHANCMDLNSISIAATRLQERMGQKGLLLAFDSLTSPYLLSGAEVIRFIRLFLSRFAAEGNSVVALIDEACGKPEDLVAMMSIADGIIKMEIRDGSRIIDVVKHPKVERKKIEGPVTWSPAISYHFDMSMVTQHIAMSMGLMAGSQLRTEVGDYVNVFWPNFARWSGMLWDPKRFPMMTYNSSKYLESLIEEFIHFLPWHRRLALRLLMPNSFSRVKDMKKLMALLQRLTEGDRGSIMEYLENASRTDEHHVRVHESDTCWGFGNVGATLGLGDLGAWAGGLMGFEKEDRDWNAVESRCVGLGDPYCEVKLVPGEINELKGSLEAIDSTIIERVYDRLMDRLMGFMLHGMPIWERPRLGNEVSLHAFNHIMVLPAMASERYRMAMRLGGAMGGKEVGERLVDATLSEDEAVKRTLSLLEYCKVGKVSMGETIRIRENCESFMIKAKEPSCYFTTGFLNGFFSAIKNQHVREIKCIAAGDPYCEWEII